MSLFNKFTETVFLKEDSELENKVNKLRELSVKYPNNKDISNQLKIAEYGLCMSCMILIWNMKI